MVDNPGRTLLSQWIKPTTQPQLPRNTSDTFVPKSALNLNENTEPRNDLSHDPPSESKQENSGDLKSVGQNLQGRREKHFNPKNPFNSYVVSLKFPKHLNEILENRPPRQNTPQNESLSARSISETGSETIKNNAEGNTEQLEDPNTSARQALHQHAEKHLPIKFERPAFIYKFRVSKEELKKLGPKPHPFFAKRKTSSGLKSVPASTSSSSNSATSPPPWSSKLRRAHLSHAPWAVDHIRPPKSWGYARTCPRNSLGRTEDDDPQLAEYVFDTKNLPRLFVPPQVKKPERVLMSSNQIKAISEHSQSPVYASVNQELVEKVKTPIPYDSGNFETRMWCDIYSPQNWQNHVTPALAKQVYEWISKQIETRAKRPERKPAPRKSYDSYSFNDGFLVDDSDGEDSNDVLIVSGPTGSGKTSAVYAAAQSQGAYVFEVSSAVKRTGRELSTMLEGISQNHAVHRAKDVVILIDDGDIIYENEAGSFWSTISRFASTSRRPVVITCTHPPLIALSAVSSETIYFPRPDYVRVTDLAWLIALSEGHIVDRMRLARIVVAWQGDIRRVLTQLQFWCQMGIGGTPSSQEWVPKQHEMETNAAERVISNGTWFPDVANDDPVLHSYLSTLTGQSHKTDSLEAQASFADTESLADTCIIHTTNHHRNSPEDTVSTNGALSMDEWSEPVIEKERGHEQYLHNVYQMESSYGVSTKDLACDVSPFMRLMVASDFQRALNMQRSLANLNPREARMARRLWTNSGIDCRHYLELSKESMEVVLKTGFPVHMLNKTSHPVSE